MQVVYSNMSLNELSNVPGRRSRTRNVHLGATGSWEDIQKRSEVRGVRSSRK